MFPRHLKIFRDDAATCQLGELSPVLAEVATICRAFNQATGSAMRYESGPAPADDPILVWSAPVDPGDGNAPGHLRIDQVGSPRGGRTAEAEVVEVRELADRLARLLAERAGLARALRNREAELAAGVPIKQHPRAAGHLAERLEAVLRGSAEGLGCQAAAMYLLDDATTELKLRAQWGLPAERLLEPARPLAGAIADLEALSGHAVVLEDDKLSELWNVPERFGAALCAPIAGPATILGTFWLFSSTPRDFNAREINLAEIVAGRLAAELDREMLWSELSAHRRAERASDGPAHFEALPVTALPFPSVPSIKPAAEGWEITGHVPADNGGEPAKPAGSFVDWLTDGAGTIRAIVGHAGGGLSGAMSAAGLRGSWRSGADRGDGPAMLFDSLGRFLWTTSAGDQQVSLVALEFLPEGKMRLATAGNAVALVRRCGSADLTTVPVAGSEAPPLGHDPDARHAAAQLSLSPGDLLVVFCGAEGDPHLPGLSFGEGRLAQLLGTADASAAHFCRQFAAAAPLGVRSILVARRRGLTGKPAGS